MKKRISIFIVALLIFLTGCSGNSHEGEAKTPSGASYQEGRNYQDVIDDFREKGFTNIRTETIEDLIFGWLTKDGEVETVSVDGDEEYSSGEWYPAGVEVVITYHTFPEEDTTDADSETEQDDTTVDSSSTEQDTESSAPDSEQEQDAESADSDLTEKDAASQTPDSESEEEEEGPVYYSTNTEEQAKNGNSGVFACRSTGGTYTNYYIVDFDGGYVYYFSDGNNNSICDKVPIESGDLNSTLIFTYHDGDYTFSEGLCFKYARQPGNKWIWSDESGWSVELVPTDLFEALRIRREKEIIEY